MKHMASGKIAFLGVLALAGCYSNPSDTINNSNYNTVQATPNFLVVHVGDSTQVIARLVNDANNGAVTNYTIGSVGAGISVHTSPNYRPVFDATKDTLVPTGDKVAQQFYVVGAQVGRYTFTLTPTSVNTGVTTTITAVVIPITLGPALSKATAATGDTIIITAAPGTLFSQTSAVSFATGNSGIVARAADSTTISVVVGIGVTGPATVTKVGVSAVPNVDVVTLVTSDSLTTPAAVFTPLPETIGNIGDVLTIHPPAGMFFSKDSTTTLSFTTGTATIISISPDLSTITFSVGAGVTGPLTVTFLGVKNDTAIAPVTLVSPNTLTTTAAVPTTVSTTTPLFGTVTAPVTVTLGGGLKFTSNSTVSFGSTPTIILSTSADSSSAVVVPFGGNTGGVVTFANIVPGANNTVIVGGPGDKSVTLGSPADPNTNTIATAPTITPPPSGGTIVISGAGSFSDPSQCGGGVTGDGCQVYKLVVTTGATFDFSLVWSGGQDMGLYRAAAPGLVSQGAGGCDNGGQNTPGESCTITLAPGTYYFSVVFFGTGSGYGASADTTPPTWYQFSIHTH